MPAPALASPLLARLRRSTRLAVFMALVVVTKLVGGYVCVGEGLPGVASGDSIVQVALVGGESHPDVVLSALDHVDPQAAHVAGSCCHCSCHQATALPGSDSFVQVQVRVAPLPSIAIGALPSRLERELRPPIV
jgi:hypothetical protein